MNGQLYWLMFTTFALLLLWVQRSEASRRRWVWSLFWLVTALTLVLAYERSAFGMMFVALGWAALLNGLFWVLIGRYNPVPSSDAMRVLGLDDE